MQSKKFFSKFLFSIAVTFFWLFLWQLLALWVNDSFFLPSPIDTFTELLKLISRGEFYRVVFFTLLRVLTGLVLGIASGIFLAVMCHKIPVVTKFIAPIITVIKAMPVATFIVLLQFTMASNSLTVFIGLLMVIPIVYQNVTNGFHSIPKELSEVCDIFEISSVKRFKILTLPTLLSYLVPAIITSIGLTFKAQVAAEIIIYAKDSIGQFMFDAKYNLNTPELFAWALVVVIFSLLLEYVTKTALRRFSK